MFTAKQLEVIAFALSHMIDEFGGVDSHKEFVGIGKDMLIEDYEDLDRYIKSMPQGGALGFSFTCGDSGVTVKAHGYDCICHSILYPFLPAAFDDLVRQAKRV